MAKILVVDDSGLARRSTRSILEQANHEVIDAQDGFAALERYALDRPDLVLLDVTMRDMSGIEVLRRLRELDTAARVVIVSADVQNSTHDMARDAGASGFVIKPATSASLLGAVSTVLEGGALWN